MTLRSLTESPSTVSAGGSMSALRLTCCTAADSRKALKVFSTRIPTSICSLCSCSASASASASVRRSSTRTSRERVAASTGRNCSASAAYTPSMIPSACPRMTVIGVRSSWATSARTERRRASSASSRPLMALKARATMRSSLGPAHRHARGVVTRLDALRGLDDARSGRGQPAQAQGGEQHRTDAEQEDHPGDDASKRRGADRAGGTEQQPHQRRPGTRQDEQQQGDGTSDAARHVPAVTAPILTTLRWPRSVLRPPRRTAATLAPPRPAALTRVHPAPSASR